MLNFFLLKCFYWEKIYIDIHWIRIVGENLSELIILASLSKKRQINRDKMTDIRKRKCFTLAVGWKDSELFPNGKIPKPLLAGETLNFFILDGIWNQFMQVFNRSKLFGEIKETNVECSQWLKIQKKILSLRFLPLKIH